MCKASKTKTKEELLSVAQEIAFAKALAANDKTLRNRALKKLRKWFSTKSRQDSPGMRFTEDGFMRVWKGLFYCVWMSDKPLVQEEVVESISNLIHCFIHLEDAQKFVCCFFQSISQAWFSLDGHRMDKYLMLIRRFLRQIFEYMRNKNWDEECVDSLCGDLQKSCMMAPIGLNLHLAEIYLEELAKVGRGELNPRTVLKILKPLSECMAVSSDTRLIKYVVDFVYLQLLRQSDEGIKYGAKFEIWKEMGFPGGDIDVIQEASEDEQDSDISMDEDEDLMDTETALDPRAGNVDTVLPPVDFNPVTIRDYLSDLSKRKDTTTKARNSIGFLIKKYNKFAEGKYPLGIHKCEVPEIEDEEEIIEKTAEELLREDKEFAKERKLFKKGKIGMVSPAVWEITPLKETNSIEAKGISNSGKWEVNNLSKRKSMNDDSICTNMKKIKITVDTSLVNSSSNDECPNLLEASITSKALSSDSGKTNKDPEPERECTTPNQNRKKRKKRKCQQNEQGNENKKPNSTTPSAEEIEQIYKILIRDNIKRQKQTRKKIEEATAEWGLTNEWDSQVEEEIVIPFTPGKEKNKGKGSSLKSETETPSASKNPSISVMKRTPNSAKKVEFVLNKNTSQGEQEYKQSLKKSPCIPFDAEKKPRQGVLKTTPVGSPINPFYKEVV